MVNGVVLCQGKQRVLFLVSAGAVSLPASERRRLLKFAVHIRDRALEKAVKLTVQIRFRLEIDVIEPSIDLYRT